MTSDNAQLSQKTTIKQPVRRVVPVIPRQLTRPRAKAQTDQTVVKPVENARAHEDKPEKAVVAHEQVLEKLDLTAEEQPKSDTVPLEEELKHAVVSPVDDAKKDVTISEVKSKSRVVSEQDANIPRQDFGNASPARFDEKSDRVDEKLGAANGEDAVAASNNEPSLSNTKTESDEEKAKPEALIEAEITRPQTKLPKPVPTQLPPPFYPSRKTHYTLPAPSETSLHSIPFGHPVNPSADSLVFGGYHDSSAPSPIPPQSSDSIFAPPRPGPMPPPGLASPTNGFEGNPQYFAHSSYPLQQPFMEWAPPAFHAVPSSRPPHANGFHRMSRTPSQTSSAIVEAPASYRAASGIATPDLTRQNHNVDSYNLISAQSSTLAPSAQQSPPNMEMNNLQDMRRYLLDRFGTYDFADYILQLAANRTFPAHSILLARSSGLKAMMHLTQQDDGSHYRRLLIPTDAYFRDDNAFIDALRSLYGGELLDPGRLLQALPAPHLASKDVQPELAARMYYVLSYVAAGLTLDVHDIHALGIHIAVRLVRWETLESSLDFVLNSGSAGRSTLHEDVHFRRGVAIQHLIRAVIEFIVLNFPIDFTLDSTAQQLASIRRLPEQQQADMGISQFPDSRRPSHHRLKSIRFGDAPAGQESSFADSTLSSVLLSLPSNILQEIFRSFTLSEKLGAVAVSRHIHALVVEREKRRSNALQAHEQSKAVATTGAMLQNLYSEEVVEPSDQDPSGFRLLFRPMRGTANQ